LVAEPFDPAQLVETVAELMAPRAQAKGIELAAHIAPDLPARLVGDRPAAPDTAEPRRQRGEVHEAGGVGLSLARTGIASRSPSPIPGRASPPTGST
jgi:hypothetical protein